MAKTITLDDLAGMVKKGFDEVYERMDTRFDRVDDRLDRLEKDMAAVRFTLTQLAYRDEVNKLEERLTRIEKHLGLAAQS